MKVDWGRVDLSLSPKSNDNDDGWNYGYDCDDDGYDDDVWDHGQIRFAFVKRGKFLQLLQQVFKHHCCFLNKWLRFQAPSVLFFNKSHDNDYVLKRFENIKKYIWKFEASLLKQILWHWWCFQNIWHVL